MFFIFRSGHHRRNPFPPGLCHILNRAEPLSFVDHSQFISQFSKFDISEGESTSWIKYNCVIQVLLLFYNIDKGIFVGYWGSKSYHDTTTETSTEMQKCLSWCLTWLCTFRKDLWCSFSTEPVACSFDQSMKFLVQCGYMDPSTFAYLSLTEFSLCPHITSFNHILFSPLLQFLVLVCWVWVPLDLVLSLSLLGRGLCSFFLFHHDF